MSVRFFYVDESYDATTFCLSAISIRHDRWKDCFDAIKARRHQLKSDYGMFVQKEIHARDFVAGRGRISPTDQPIGKWRRSRIFHGMLELVAKLPSVMVFNVALPVVGCADPQLTAWDRLINRIERTMLEFDANEGKERKRLIAAIEPSLDAGDFKEIALRLRLFQSRAFIISDEGRETEIVRAIRKMHILNHIPSKYGQWPDGNSTKNIVTSRIIEDPVFKPSHRSHFLQLADCVAFALLKREVAPTSNISKYKIDKMFQETVASVCYLKAAKSDPLGIVRK